MIKARLFIWTWLKLKLDCFHSNDNVIVRDNLLTLLFFVDTYLSIVDPTLINQFRLLASQFLSYLTMWLYYNRPKGMCARNWPTTVLAYKTIPLLLGSGYAICALIRILFANHLQHSFYLFILIIYLLFIHLNKIINR